VLRGEGAVAASRRRFGSRKLIAPAIAMVALAIPATAAYAASTRAEYVAQADPICQAGQAQEAIAAQPLLRATKRAQKHHALDKKGTQKKLTRLFSAYLTQWAAIEHQVNSQIAAVPPAPDDVSLIQVWLRARNELVDLESQLVNSFKHPKRIKNPFKLIQKFFELTARQFEVSDLVRDFGFQYCNSVSDVQIIGNTFPSA
jgi:hypothetical protein